MQVAVDIPWRYSTCSYVIPSLLSFSLAMCMLVSLLPVSLKIIVLGLRPPFLIIFAKTLFPNIVTGTGTGQRQILLSDKMNPTVKRFFCLPELPAQGARWNDLGAGTELTAAEGREVNVREDPDKGVSSAGISSETVSKLASDV